MADIKAIATAQLQLAINRKLFEQKKISRDVYGKANDLLAARLKKWGGCATIKAEPMQNNQL